MSLNDNKSAKDRLLANYYGDEGVTALITLKVDTKNVESLASKVSNYDDVEDVFLVTGDIDIVVKAHFRNYESCNDFVLNTVRRMEGVKDTKTLMVVTVYKERGAHKLP